MDDEMVPKEIIERFQTLWEVYWAGTGQSDAREKPDAWLFGSWFVCPQFPEQWSLEQLEESVKVVPIPEPDDAVIERLALIAHIDNIGSVRVLSHMIRDDREGWRMYGWRDSIEQILTTALDTGDAARAEAVQLLEYLARRGFPELDFLMAKKGHTKYQ